MEQSELNKELEEIIGQATDDGHIWRAANECERICLEKQIELLMELEERFMNMFLIKSAKELSYKNEELQQQLNQLKQ